MSEKIKTITNISILCVISYILTIFFRIPISSFLKYDPKDIIITLGGLIFNPGICFLVTVIVCFLEMITVGSTGIFGFLMNVLSTLTFSVTVSTIYNKLNNKYSLLIGLMFASIFSALFMVLTNLLIIPFYMKITWDLSINLILWVFLPFNILKCLINSLLVLLFYKIIKNLKLKI